jgi:hypothetical protein
MRKYTVLLPIVMLLVGCASASSFVQQGYNFARIHKVAVVEVTGANNNVNAQNEVADLWAMELLKRGYNVIERTQVQSILDEQDFQATDFTTAAGAAEMGRILNVDAIFVANVPEMQSSISMTAKMIDVETGSLLWIGEGTGRAGSGVGTVTGALLGAAAGGVIGHQVDSGSGGPVGAIAGGVGGGVAGHALEPTTRQALRKVVAKVARGLPARTSYTYR